MYNWSFLFVVLHKQTLLPSTFKLLDSHVILLQTRLSKILGYKKDLIQQLREMNTEAERLVSGFIFCLYNISLF